MAFVFLLGLFLYYIFVLRRHAKDGSVLAMLLWVLYVALGVSAVILEVTGGIEPIYKPNYFSVIFLLFGVLVSISGFLQFRERDVIHVIEGIRGQKIIENVLIFLQLLAMVFFFAICNKFFDGRC